MAQGYFSVLYFEIEFLVNEFSALRKQKNKDN